MIIQNIKPKYLILLATVMFIAIGGIALAAGDPDMDPPLAPLPDHPPIPTDNPSGQMSIRQRWMQNRNWDICFSLTQRYQAMEV